MSYYKDQCFALREAAGHLRIQTGLESQSDDLDSDHDDQVTGMEGLIGTVVCAHPAAAPVGS